MKIRLTESQYKRLLKENDMTNNDDIFNSTNIGNKITISIAKLFINLYKSGKYSFDTSYIERENPLHDSNFRETVNRIEEILGTTKSESIILAHNYCSVYNNEIVESFDKGDISLLIGKPLKFYGKYTYPTTIYHHGYVTGWSDGSVEVYATDLEMFSEKIESGTVEVDELGDSNIDYDTSNISFEYDWDYTYDTLKYTDIEKDLITIKI